MSYKFDSIVNKSEADALKEMIFKRARERSQAMSENVQSDVMELARDSFVSKDNPFSRILKEEEEETKVENKTEEKEAVGFPQRTPKLRQDKITNEQITSLTINNNMAEARTALSNKKSFMGALNFLNSQAAISLIRTRGDKFEIIA